MLPDPFTTLSDFAPDHPVQVLPRYLAGPGPVDLQAIWPFPFDAGWHLHPAQEGMIFASSPCARLWTRFAPAAEGSARAWTIGASRTPFCKSSWEVSFDAATPAELLRDVHAKLLDLYLNESRSGKDSLFDDTTLSSEAYLPLLADGWSHSILRDGTQTFRAPNKLCRLRHQYDAWAGSDAEAWAVSAGEPDDPYWEARFSRHAPTALAVAFTASLISAKPVIRTAKDVPLLTRHDLRLADGAPKQAPSRPAPVPPISAPARRR